MSEKLPYGINTFPLGEGGRKGKKREGILDGEFRSGPIENLLLSSGNSRRVTANTYIIFQRQHRSEYEIDALKTAAFIEHMARGKQKIRKAQPNANLLLVASKKTPQLPQVKPSISLCG